MSEQILTHGYLKEHLHYSVITGQFYRIKKISETKNYREAGGVKPNGYRYISIGNCRYLEHRLAWFWVTGEWPKNQIDHINGAKNNNYWLNLREATISENQCNIGITSDNASGFKGVYWSKRDKKWIAEIAFNKKKKYLGSHAKPEMAYEAYCREAKKLHGEFAKTS